MLIVMIGMMMLMVEIMGVTVRSLWLIKTIHHTVCCLFRHYFQKVCYHWAKQGKFTPAKIKAIMSHTGNTNASAAWLLLSEISSFKPKLNHKTIIECCNEYMSKGEY